MTAHATFLFKEYKMFRVRMDETFEDEADARALFDFASKMRSKAVNINEGAKNEEIGFVEMHECRHDEGLPCKNSVKVEVERG